MSSVRSKNIQLGITFLIIHGQKLDTTAVGSPTAAGCWSSAPGNEERPATDGSWMENKAHLHTVGV
ncbi:hypothetical protein U9M48_032478 [Paspalum notatum var. saurae]|uniref:Uncharacterized protein n=1 Tax=Paspalum notatum var. saurae TaxID=547442 RepID=A0AAQ3X5G0_PASNO